MLGNSYIGVYIMYYNVYVCTFLDVYFTVEENIIPVTSLHPRPINCELLGPRSLYFKQDSQIITVEL